MPSPFNGQPLLGDKYRPKALFCKEYQWIIWFSEISVPEQFRELANLGTQMRNDIFRQVVQRSRTLRSSIRSVRLKKFLLRELTCGPQWISFAWVCLLVFRNSQQRAAQFRVYRPIA